LPEVCVTYKVTRSSDVYDLYQTLRHPK